MGTKITKLQRKINNVKTYTIVCLIPKKTTWKAFKNKNF